MKIGLIITRQSSTITLEIPFSKYLQKNKFWKIKDIDNGCKENEYRNTHNSCTSGGSASNFEIILIRKLKISTKNYFNPIFYETECCPGNKDRQIFIKCFNAVNSLFPPP